MRSAILISFPSKCALTQGPESLLFFFSCRYKIYNKVWWTVQNRTFTSLAAPKIWRAMPQPSMQVAVDGSNQLIQGSAFDACSCSLFDIFIWGIVIVLNDISYLVPVQQVVHTPSLSYADFNTDTASLRVISNAQIGECSSAVAASDIDGISTLTILRLPRLVTLSITAAIAPYSFRQNQRVYGGRILNILRSCKTLVEVKVPLEFHSQNGSMLLALKALRDLSILELRLPTTFTPTQQDIDRLHSQLVRYLRGFHQIQVLTLPIHLSTPSSSKHSRPSRVWKFWR